MKSGISGFKRNIEEVVRDEGEDGRGERREGRRGDDSDGSDDGVALPHLAHAVGHTNAHSEPAGIGGAVRCWKIAPGRRLRTQIELWRPSTVALHTRKRVSNKLGSKRPP